MNKSVIRWFWMNLPRISCYASKFTDSMSLGQARMQVSGRKEVRSQKLTLLPHQLLPSSAYCKIANSLVTVGIRVG